MNIAVMLSRILWVSRYYTPIILSLTCHYDDNFNMHLINALDSSCKNYRFNKKYYNNNATEIG